VKRPSDAKTRACSPAGAATPRTGTCPDSSTLFPALRPAHAEIVSIDVEATTARKGVHLVLTGADYAASGWKSLPGGVSYEGVGGQKQKKPFWPALAHGKVHYVGQPVALVVADSPALAQDASEDIALEYRDLPAAIGFEAATAASASQLHADIPATSPSSTNRASARRCKPRSPARR